MNRLVLAILLSSCLQILPVGESPAALEPDSSDAGGADASIDELDGGNDGGDDLADAGDGGGGGLDAGSRKSDGGRSLAQLGYGEWRIISSPHHAINQLWVASPTEAWAISETGRLLAFDGSEWLLLRPVSVAPLVALHGSDESLVAGSATGFYEFDGAHFVARPGPGGSLMPHGLAVVGSEVLALLASDGGTYLAHRTQAGLWARPAEPLSPRALFPRGLVLTTTGASAWVQGRFEDVPAVAGYALEAGLEAADGTFWWVTGSEVMRSTRAGLVARAAHSMTGPFSVTELGAEMLTGAQSLMLFTRDGGTSPISTPLNGAGVVVAATEGAYWACARTSPSPCMWSGSGPRLRSFSSRGSGKPTAGDGGVLLLPTTERLLIRFAGEGVSFSPLVRTMSALAQPPPGASLWGTTAEDAGGVWELSGGSWRLAAAELPTDALHDIWGPNDSNIWAVGSRGQSSLIMFWNGQLWRYVINGRPAARLNGVWGRNISDVWAVGVSTVGRGTVLELTPNGWTNASVPNAAELSCITGDDTNVWVGGRGGVLLRGAPPVRPWSRVSTPFTGDVTAVALTTSALWVAELTNGETALWEHDGGSWRRSATLPTRVHSLVVAPPDLWAAGEDGTLARLKR